MENNKTARATIVGCRRWGIDSHRFPRKNCAPGQPQGDISQSAHACTLASEWAVPTSYIRVWHHRRCQLLHGSLRLSVRSLVRFDGGWLHFSERTTQGYAHPTSQKLRRAA